MNIDAELLAKLRLLDERQLTDILGMIAEAAGADEKQKKRLLDNAGYIKRRIDNSNDAELKRTAEKLLAGDDIDRDALNNLLNKLRGL